jgi:hypothetical protein
MAEGKPPIEEQSSKMFLNEMRQVTIKLMTMLRMLRKEGKMDNSVKCKIKCKSNYWLTGISISVNIFQFTNDLIP